MSREIGTTLQNGAQALDVTWHDSEPDGDARGIGLFLWLDSPHPFVVWSVNRNKGAIDAWNGTYFTNIHEAMSNYRSRGGVA